MFALEDHHSLDATDSEFRAMGRETALVVQRGAFFRLQHWKQASLGFEPLNEGSRSLPTIIVEREDVIPGGEHAGREIELELLKELRRDALSEPLADQGSVSPGKPGCGE